MGLSVWPATNPTICYNSGLKEEIDPLSVHVLFSGVTLASGLRFRWSWYRYDHVDESFTSVSTTGHWDHVILNRQFFSIWYIYLWVDNYPLLFYRFNLLQLNCEIVCICYLVLLILYIDGTSYCHRSWVVASFSLRLERYDCNCNILSKSIYLIISFNYFPTQDCFVGGT